MSNFDEVREADQPRLNPDIYEEYYNYGFLRSIQEHPRAEDFKHVMNASKYAEEEMKKDMDAILERRRKYTQQLESKLSDEELNKYKEIRNMHKEEKESRANRGGNKNKKSKRRTNRRK
jgi:hypothetical protein